MNNLHHLSKVDIRC